MNKTLLLILCDFLLLSLLALTRWEVAKPVPPGAVRQVSVAREAPGTATPAQDLVAVMQLSLEDEQARRDTLVLNLAQTEAARADAEQAKLTLTENLAQTAKTAAQLDQALAATRASAEAERARNVRLAGELAEREAEAARRNTELTRVTAAEAAARARVEELAVTVGVAQREKQILQEQAETLRAAVETERAERQRAQQTTTDLAVGVGQIAEQTGALSKEIREARPINGNTLFNDFLARRVRAQFAAERSTFLGPITRHLDTRTLLASDGKNAVALLHVDDTPFDLRDLSQPDWAKLTLTLTRGAATVLATRIEFTSIDPRILAIPLTSADAAKLGGEPYLLALEPFKFPEAVLISAGGTGYGELPFKLDPKNPGYVKVDNRLVRRIFGEFSPSRGDLVLSKTGELLGLMVTAETCALITNFLPQCTLALGVIPEATPTGAVLNGVAKRYLMLPSGVK